MIEDLLDGFADHRAHVVDVAVLP
eukprot:COSAG01_NODE_42797_length_436_cov_1.278932_1_plen_23_part_10